MPWCKLPKYANSLEPFCVRFVQRVCVCVCWLCASSMSQSDLWPPALQHLGPHGALIPGWVTHGSDVLSLPVPPHPPPPWRRLSGLVLSSLFSQEPEQSADLGALPVCRQSSWNVEPPLEEAAASSQCPPCLGGGGLCKGYTCGGGMMAHLR